MFPVHIRSVFHSATHEWPICGQGFNECNFYALANALNTMQNAFLYDPQALKRRVGFLFQARLGGTFPFLKSMLLRQLGFGSHFGNLRYTDAEFVLRQLIDMHIPVLVDIYTAAQFGLTRFYGQHSVVLVGYSHRFRDAWGNDHEEYYLIDSEWPRLGSFSVTQNNIDRDGDGIAEDYPGNRTVSRAQFLKIFTTRCYSPIFPSQSLHDQWYCNTFAQHTPRLWEKLVSGTNDRLKIT
jgi:hypothetical protein